MNFDRNNKSQLNNKLKNTIDYMSDKMSNVNQNHPNPVELLNPEDIAYLQSYLEQIKIKKLHQQSKPNNEPINTYNNNMPFRSNHATDIYDLNKRDVPVNWNIYSNPNLNQINTKIDPSVRGPTNTRTGKKSQQNIGSNNMNPNRVNDYYNPYEYGAKQNSLPPIYKQPYHGPYYNDTNILNNMGVPENAYHEKFPGRMRNVNIENSLLQKEMTHIPGQRGTTGKEINRFEQLPFNPQDPRHIVWTDNMPRGGYATRADRLEY